VGPSDLVLLFDVDNSLVDNDAVTEDLHRHLTTTFGEQAAERYWQIFEQRRRDIGFADYLGALQLYRLEDLNDPRLLGMSEFLLDYPFHQRLFPGALDVVHHANAIGTGVILSDGDAVFQPRKCHLAGLWRAFHGRVLIYIHKEKMLDDVEHWYPAPHYVIVDDKMRILDAVKQQWGLRVTTVFVRQGHYAMDTAEVARYAPADLVVEEIAQFLDFGPEELHAAAIAVPR
jgi:FMN phosphatase YigB (HAD superfamily)